MIRQPSKVRRHKGKLKMDTALNLVSLMDIFTILLLFLLVQSSSDEVLSSSETLHLPTSSSQIPIKPAITIFITQDQIVAEGIPVGTVAEALASADPVIPGLAKEMGYQAQKTLQIAKSNASVQFQGRVMVMGDRDIPFAVLKKVMVTCSRAGYPNIALSVIQKERTST